VELKANVGAPAAYNVGIKNAREDYEYILKLDNDVVLKRNCLAELVDCAESDSQIGFVGGKVYYYSDNKRLHLIGSKVRPFYGGGLGIGKYRLDKGRYEKDLQLDAVNGCMALVKRSVIDEVGLMDERYFLYFDDLDWALRAMGRNFKNVYRHKAVAFHNTSHPYMRFQSKVWLHYAVYNGFYFMKKHYSGLARFAFLSAIHVRVAGYIIGVFLNNKGLSRRELIKTIINAYTKGLKYIWKSE